TLSIGGSGATVQLGSNSLHVPESVFESRPALRGYDQRELTVGLRPEDLEDPALGDGVSANHSVDAEVVLVESLGAEIMVHFNIDAVAVDAGDPDATDEISTGVSGYSRCVARFNPRSRVALGQRMAVSVDTSRFHYFDAESGSAIVS
ncbi:MAG: ABC transporter ATP-binding protein, partial [Actinobacteria bacterium]|nr:ABC transporter ATP-binding protein [Actinomycetota bacterium]